MFCTKCGAKIPDDAKFCKSCGKEVIPSIDIELGNAMSAHDDATLERIAEGLSDGMVLCLNKK